MRNATSSVSTWVPTLALLLAFGTAGITSAQTPFDAGDEFIVFVDGVNVLVPGFDGSPVADPEDANNTVAQFGYGAWAAPGFQFNSSADLGRVADMTSMVSETVGSGKTLYVSLRVDPTQVANTNLCTGADGDYTAPDGCLSLTFFDYANGGAVEDNREGRLKWYIPAWYRDGNWHELAIPLPPSTHTALDSAKAGVDVTGAPLATPLDSLAFYWDYAGGWSPEVPGWGGTSGSPRTDSDPNWQPFEWDKIRGITVHFDFNTGADVVLVDNLYIGDETTDIVAAAGVPAAMSGVSVTEGDGFNEISWTHNPDFGGYTVYYDLEPVTQARIGTGDAVALATVPFNAAEFRVEHAFEVPHPAMAPMEIHYAVTSKSLFGSENTDVTNSAASISNASLPQKPVIWAMTESESDLVFNNIAAGTVSDDGFPDTAPFAINQNRFKLGDATAPPDSDEDLSAILKVAFDRFQGGTLYFYAEVTDQSISLIKENEAIDAGNLGWNYDAIELGWGSYDVRDIEGGSILGGSPHQNFGNDAEPDYQLRLIGYDPGGDGTVFNGATTFFAADQPGSEVGEFGVPVGSGAAADILTDGSGNPIGWKFLAGIPFESLVVASLNHVPFGLPAADAFKLVPFNFVLVDADDGGTRKTQIQWSLQPNADGQWWNTPSQWEVVAVSGRALATDTEEEGLETPLTYTLDQNYPNPFNPATTINFSLAGAEQVRLEVFNVLGQRVATLVDGQVMTAGTHKVQFDASELASGMYLYRLDAGEAFSRTRSMMLLK